MLNNDILEQLATARTTGYIETPLHLAAYVDIPSSHQDAVRQIAGHCQVSARNALDETPIHRAALLNNSGAIRLLGSLQPHALELVDCFGRSPVWHAAATGSVEALRVLLSRGALINVNLADDLGLTPLHTACRGGHEPAAAMLLKKGARQYVTTHKLDLTPMDLAAMFGHEEILEGLEFDGLGPLSETQAMHNRALHIAASCGQLSCVKTLLSAGANWHASYDYYFKLTLNHAEVVERCGDARFVAALEGHEDIFKYFDSQLAPPGQSYEPTVQVPSHPDDNSNPYGMASGAGEDSIPPGSGIYYYRSSYG